MINSLHFSALTIDRTESMTVRAKGSPVTVKIEETLFISYHIIVHYHISVKMYIYIYISV